jgi:carboxypeptidase family protein
MGHTRVRGLTFCFLVSSLLPCQVQPQQSSLAEKASIQGLVINATTSEPLKGVRVRLTRSGEYRTLYRGVSDAVGQFSIQNIEAGSYQIRIEKEGYHSPNRGCSSDIQDDDVITLSVGQSLSGLKFQMLAPAVITGHVFDSSGNPITEAEVGAYLIAARSGRRFLLSEATARTDDRGQYRLFHLKPGPYLLRLDQALRLRDELEEHTDAAKELGFRPIYYPDTFGIDDAQKVMVHPGQELTDKNFTAHFAKVLRLRGKVLNGLTNEPMADGVLAIEALDNSMKENKATSYTIRDDGHFEVEDLTPGRYLVSVETGTLPDRRLWQGQQEVELKDSDLSVAIRAFPGHDVSGRIEIQDGNKIDFTHLQVQLEPYNDLSYGGRYIKVNADGRFLIPDVGQDVYDVGIAGLPSLYYLKSTILGDTELSSGRLTIGDATESASLILRISKPGAEVTGQVQTADGNRACSAHVVLIPDSLVEHSPRARYAEADADQFGNYSLKEIVPGDYRLFAWDQDSPIPYLEHGSLEPYESQGRAVHLNEGDRLTVPLKLISAGAVDP